MGFFDEVKVSGGSRLLSSVNVDAFASVIQKHLSDPDSAFRKNYVRMFIERVEVDDDEIRISGPKSALVGGLVESTIPDTRQGVPSFDKEWWARQDSNLQPDRYERPALTS